MTSAIPSPNTKQCPFCAEEIKSEAVKCRFCGEYIEKQNSLKTPKEKLPPKEASKRMREELRSMAQEGRQRKNNPRLQAEIKRDIQSAKAQKLATKAEEPVKCPRCGSTQLNAQRRGFGWGKALVGGVLTFGTVGILGGFIGSRKILITCLKCGCQFYPKKK